MAYDRNISPVGWYIGSYLLRFIELRAKGNHDPRKKFIVWENTVIVKAKNLDKAYDKVVKLAKSQTKPYKGGIDAVPVRWVFEGVTELLPIYERLEDGAEVMWSKFPPTSLKKIRSWSKKKSRFRQ